MEKSVLSFDTQCNITDFYNEFNDIQSFEKSVLNFILSTDKEKQVQIIDNLRTEIVLNTDIYTANKDFFDEIDIINVCAKRYNPLKIEIDGQLTNSNKLWKELTQVRNSLESASWKNDKIAIQRLTKYEERLEQTYKKEQEKLRFFYKQQKESDNHAFKYLENAFGKIYVLGCYFISLLNSYFPIEKGEDTIVDIAEPIFETPQEIDPDTIFRTGMYDRFLSLEQQLIKDNYLNEALNWVAKHDKTHKPDIKSLIIFLVGLLDNKYFLPGKDTKIRVFFENRYNITIGQNFESKRREPLLDSYKVIFYNYDF
ncbi:hypothetical protein [Dysgonomonas sp. HGC4]|uniref:hypothetical protein n=1 Tax=Dysgonomonas sp. HGC4 TaxID=1658009 RepID=UPI0012FA7809|nr:hypothetical protein [Dysgonomonas sp. HGC4]MBD8347665.1 hypothetical protein [Dysgonomonas sp. HGC4]